MLFHCPKVMANFPAQGLQLINHASARLIWDEHGGTFVLRVEGLEVMEAAEDEVAAEIRLEVDLPEAASLAHRIESFAGGHSMKLAQVAATEVISEAPILTACHVPGKQLFIYCENPVLTFRRGGAQSMEVRIRGVFKMRRLPCRETDLVVHLEAVPMAQLLSGLLAWAREG